MLNLNFQLQSTVMKAQAKQIDLELRKLDANQASDNLAFVQVNALSRCMALADWVNLTST
jgi:hypothetical protein